MKGYIVVLMLLLVLVVGCTSKPDPSALQLPSGSVPVVNASLNKTVPVVVKNVTNVTAPPKPTPPKANSSVNQSNFLGDEYHYISINASCRYVKSKDSGWMPDPKCSPGDYFPLTTIKVNGSYAAQPGGAFVGDICTPGYSDNIRDVTDKDREAIYQKYGIIKRNTGEYEIDHIVPLSLAGTNDYKNLYPQPAIPTPGFKQKDIVESCLHRKVCNGEINLSNAINIMAKNWTQGMALCGVKY